MAYATFQTLGVSVIYEDMVVVHWEMDPLVPELAFSEEELQEGLVRGDGFLGWRAGVQCFIGKIIDYGQ